jgi:RNA polymerase sigma factor (sigma-70 family)
MADWQRSRNYRIRAGESGKTRFTITVDGIETEVTPEVYEAYAQGDRRERCMAERDAGRLLSLEQLDFVFVSLALFAESAAQTEDAAIRRIMGAQAMKALEQLAPEERDLIQSLILNGETEREYAGRIGMSQKGVNKRKHKILKKLKKISIFGTQPTWFSGGINERVIYPFTFFDKRRPVGVAIPDAR